MYIGYYSALSHHGLTEQVPRTVYVVTPTRAQSREIHGVPPTASRRSPAGSSSARRRPPSRGPPSRSATWRRPSSIVLTIPGSVAASASSRAQCAPPTNKAVPGKPSASISSASTTAPRPSGSSTSPTSLASAFPPERGSSRRSRVAIPCWTPRVRDRVDSQHVPGPHQYRAGHAGADGVLAESANSQRKAACCVTPPSIYRSLHKIR